MESQSPAKDNEFAATLIDMDYQRVMGYIISNYSEEYICESQENMESQSSVEDMGGLDAQLEALGYTKDISCNSKLSKEKSKAEREPPASTSKDVNPDVHPIYESGRRKVILVNKGKKYDSFLPTSGSFEKKSVTEQKCSTSTGSFKKKSMTEPKPAASTSKGNKLLQDFKELYLNQEDSDVIIDVQGHEFPAHRNILKARSPVFAFMLKHYMKKETTGILYVEDCDPSSFSDFLCFLYCGTLENLSMENVFSLFNTADKYDVRDLRMECLEFMGNNLSVDTFCDTITLAFQHSEKELIEIATDFYKKNLQEIIVTVKWQSFLMDYPMQCNELLIKALVNKK